MLNFDGVILGVITFLIIGIFHPIVIKCEYYFGAKIWPLFLILGIICGVFSLLSENFLISGILGVLACVLLWCIRELKEQEGRVERGWFPKNPNKK